MRVHVPFDLIIHPRRILSPTAIFVFIFIIGSVSAFGVEHLMTTSDRAWRAEVETARAIAAVERIQELQLTIQLNPSQAARARADTLALRDLIAAHIATLTTLAPGSVSRALVDASATFERSLEPTSDPMAGAIAVTRAAELFSAELARADEYFSHQAERQRELTRYGAIALFFMRAIMIGGLAAVLVRMQRQSTNLLKRKEAWFRGLVQQGADVISVIDREGIIRFQSQSLRRLLGLEAESVVGVPYRTLIHGEDHGIFHGLIAKAMAMPATPAGTELRLAHADGTWRAVEIIATNHHDNPDIGGLLLTAHDVTERNHLMAQLRHQASHDALTGLPKKSLLFDRLRQALARAGRRQEQIGVLFLDLDGFKQINDSLGHEAGDHMLRTVADRIGRVIRPMDTVSRIGGDEFIVLLDLIDEQALAAIVTRIGDAIAEPTTWNGRTMAVTASIGVVISDDPTDTEESLVRRADDAMYVAKRAGKNAAIHAHRIPHELRGHPPVTAKANGDIHAEDALIETSAERDLPIPAGPRR